MTSPVNDNYSRIQGRWARRTYDRACLHHTLNALMAALLCLSAPATATSVQGQIDLRSDYPYRGYSKSLHDPVIQAGVEISLEQGAYAGVWFSQVEFRGFPGFESPADQEYLVYAGWSHPVSKHVQLDANWTRYLYDDDVFGKHYNYNELYASVGLNQQWYLSWSWSDDAYASGRPASYAGLRFARALPAGLLLSGGVYRNVAERVFGVDYTHWDLGLSRQAGRFTLDLRMHDSDTDADRIFGSSSFDKRVVFSIGLPLHWYYESEGRSHITD